MWVMIKRGTGVKRLSGVEGMQPNYIIDRERGTIQFVGVSTGTVLRVSYSYLAASPKHLNRKGKRRGGRWWLR